MAASERFPIALYQDPDLVEQMRVRQALASCYKAMGNLSEAATHQSHSLQLAKILDLPEEKQQLLATAQAEMYQQLKKQTNNRLSECYTKLFAPLEEHLTPGSRVTLISDAALSALPFAIFQDSEGHYLIEKYILTTIPSLETLQKIDTLCQQKNHFP